VSPGDEITVTSRPDHGITIGLVFRALTLEPQHLPEILRAEALPEPLRELAERRTKQG
jgi:MOSC domain-containing protein YiiM